MAVEWKREGLTQFIPAFVEWLENESCVCLPPLKSSFLYSCIQCDWGLRSFVVTILVPQEDLGFGLKMPESYGKVEMNTLKFNEQVENLLTEKENGTGPFVCVFAYGGRAKVPALELDMNKMLIASRGTIDKLVTVNKVRNRTADLRFAFEGRAKGEAFSWLELYDILLSSETLEVGHHFVLTMTINASPSLSMQMIPILCVCRTMRTLRVMS